MAVKRLRPSLLLLSDLRAPHQPVEGIVIPPNESQQCGIDRGIDQLNAGGAPVLPQSRAEHQDLDEQRAAHEGKPGAETDEEQKA
jgi:hypothetical protein